MAILIRRDGNTTYGGDPELFLFKDGQVIGSERVIPEPGLIALYQDARWVQEDIQRNGDVYYKTLLDKPLEANDRESKGKIVRDGVQVEVHLAPDTCRARAGNNLATFFNTLRRHLKSHDDVKVSFDAMVTVPKAELDALSPKSRTLGCQPSFNIYDDHADLGVDPNAYPHRSAGGHIHIGILDRRIWFRGGDVYDYQLGAYKRNVPAKDNRKMLIAILDVLVGNTCVLIDRDPGSAERRKVYGRAGEYRLPSHGVEYRTLSNFWLKAYPLLSMILGLCRIAISALSSSLDDNGDPIKDSVVASLMQRVDLQLVRKAINENDFELAKKNWFGVRAWMLEHLPGYPYPQWQERQNYKRNPKTGGYILDKDGQAQFETTYGPTTTVQQDPTFSFWTEMIPVFEYFVDKVQEGGLEYWFPQDPMDHWCNLPDGHTCGWETFIWNTVRGRMAVEEEWGSQELALEAA